MQDSANKIYGKLPAFVVENADPEGLGRLRVRVPTLLDDPLPSWALPCVAYAGEDEDGRPRGLHLIPPPGTRVWVEFAGGDLNHPIWTGCFWDPAEAPGADAEAG